MRALIDQVLPQVARRGRQLRTIMVAEGLEGIGGRVRQVIATHIQPSGHRLPVLERDILAADLNRTRPPRKLEGGTDVPLTINWVTTPPGIGSGGHTTLFRIINHLEAIGYRNRVHFYDVHRADHQYYEAATRRYFGFKGTIVPMGAEMQDAHAVFATSWPTAYPVFNSPCAGKRFYFVQDFEPSFHPMGTESILAENTYRMGFHAVTAGRWLAEKLAADYAMAADHFSFGCDVSRYRCEEKGRRPGVAFYARPGAARRGFELGLLALEVFARRQPDVELHFYGERIGSLPFRFIDYGPVTPDRLNAIYNRCFAGLSLSLTNVSLVPHEMLAAGCIPVVNDAVQNRIVLDNSFVRYAAPDPHALASELEAILFHPDSVALSEKAASSVRSSSWQDAADKVHAVLQRELGRDDQAENGAELAAQAC